MCHLNVKVSVPFQMSRQSENKNMRAEERKETMRIKHSDSKTAMGVALTLLAAGIIVQLTDALQLFGHKSVIPLMIGGIVIIIGLVVVFVMHRMEVARKGSKDKNVI
jgi:hypothetical protein